MEQLSLLPKTNILARLTELEIKKNIFIVGHRLFTIQNPKAMPWKLTIQSESGQKFTPKTIALSFKDVEIYYTLFGVELVIPLLIAQEHANDILLKDDNTETTNTIVRCHVLDVGTYYQDHGLAAGDYLAFQSILDEDTVFKVRPIFAKDITNEDREAYFAALDIGLDRAIKKLKFPRDPQTMINAIIQEAPDLVRENPKGSFSDYYNTREKVQMYFIEGHSYLWLSGMDEKSIYDLLSNEDFLSPLEKQARELNRTMAEMGLSLDPYEIEAFIKDELIQGHTVDSALGRCFKGLELAGYSPEQIQNIYNKTKAYGLEIEKTYNPELESKDAIRLRSQILTAYEAFLFWMRRIQSLATPDILENPELLELLNSTKYLCNTIRMLNIPGLKLNKSEIKELQTDIENYEFISVELMEAIDLQLNEQFKSSPFIAQISPKKKRTKSSGTGNRSQKQHSPKKQKKRPPAEKHYICKITLAGIEPEIYRDVLIPGNRSLAEVSEIILTAMGWDGYHLHLFDIRGQHYGQPTPDDWDPLEDERKVRLDNLRFRKGSHFVYIYDFGDSWVHDITILGTQKANPDIEQVPLLLEGKRACPPEDCGSIYGYMNILEILTKPNKYLTKEEQEIIEWLPPDFDPEYFDFQTTMQALSTL